MLTLVQCFCLCSQGDGGGADEQLVTFEKLVLFNTILNIVHKFFSLLFFMQFGGLEIIFSFHHCAGKTSGIRVRFRLRSPASRRRTWRSLRRERPTLNSWRLAWTAEHLTEAGKLRLKQWTCSAHQLTLPPLSSPGWYHGCEPDLQGPSCDDPWPGRYDWYVKGKTV